MIKRLKYQLRLLIEANLKGYIILASVFAAGAVIAFVFRGKSLPEEEIRLYISDFFSNASNMGAGSIKTFYASLLTYLKTALILLFSSVCLIGAPVTLLFALTSGFSYGLVFCALFRTFGMKAILVFLCAIFPHIIISAPAAMAYALHCMKNSYHLIRGEVDFKKSLITPLVFALFFLGISGVAALIQTYVEPFLISAIASKFV